MAGIVPGDTLIAYDGVDVVGQPINLSQLLTPDKKVAVTVRRDGETKAFTVIVGRQPNEVFARRFLSGDGPVFSLPDVPGAPAGDGLRRGLNNVARVYGRGGSGSAAAWRGLHDDDARRPCSFSTVNGVFGASLSTVGADLARALKLEPGVLVNEVPEDTPAFRAGLKAGDVIVRVAGEPVTSVDELRNLAVLRGENHTVTLQIIRDKKPRSITVK